jgi:hypothetical protein
MEMSIPLTEEQQATLDSRNEQPIPLGGDPLHDLPKFPLEALPEPIRIAAEEVARFDKVPVESPATIALSMLATAIGKNAIVEERTGLDHYPALFFALVAGSGERKSPPFRKMQAPFIRYIEEQAESHQRLSSEVQACNDTIQHRIKRLLKDAEKADNQIKRKDIVRQIADLKAELKALPMDPRRFTSDCTEQVLFRLMESHGGQFSIQSGEGRPVFDAILGKYSGEGRTGDGMILAGISGDTITRDRIGSADSGGQESGVILHPCLNVCVMIQPDKYLQVARHPNLRASGALARIWPVWLPSMVGTRMEAEGEAGLNTRAMQGYNALVTGLLATIRDQSHRVTLSPGAAELRREFHNNIESMMLEGEELADVRDIASKATSQAVKLALVLHVASHQTISDQDTSVIDTDTMSRAIHLGAYFLHQSVSSQRHADEDAQLAPARRILEWMHKTGKERLSFSEIQQYAPRPRLSAKELITVMELLADHRHVVPIDTGGKHPDYQLRDGDGK